MAKKKPAKKSAKPAKKSAAKPAAKPAAKSAATSGAKSAAKSGAKSAAKSGAKSGAKASAKPAAKSGARATAKSGAKANGRSAKSAGTPGSSIGTVELLLGTPESIDAIIEVAFTDVGSAPPAAEPAGNAETEAAQFLKDYDDGNIDNAWDVIGDLAELDKRLSKSSPLRPAFDKMYGEIEDICRESSGS